VGGAVEIVGPQPDQAAGDQALQARLLARFASPGEQGERARAIACQRHSHGLREAREPAHPRFGGTGRHRGRAVLDHFRVIERENPDDGKLRRDASPEVRGSGVAVVR
jgi:hypothetical protein